MVRYTKISSDIKELSEIASDKTNILRTNDDIMKNVKLGGKHVSV